MDYGTTTTPRDRVYKALRFEQPDIVPYQVNLTAGARRKLADYYGNEEFEQEIGNHIAALSHRNTAPWVEVEPGHFRDEWGVVWNKTVDKDIGVVENRVLPKPTLDGFELPNLRSPEIHKAYPEFIEQNPDRFRIGTIGFSMFERAWSLRGMDRILMDMIENPQFVHALFDRILEFNLAHIDIALSYDIDCVYFGDDWGSQNGLIMGPGLWREFIKPRVTQMYQCVRRAGKYAAIHSCGDVKVLLPELIEAGLNIFNPFQPETMDIFETKKRYYGQLSFYGGISVQHLLPHGTPVEVRRETRRLLDELGQGGGYIASPSHAVPVDVPPENLAGMIEVLKGQ